MPRTVNYNIHAGVLNLSLVGLSTFTREQRPLLGPTISGRSSTPAYSLFLSHKLSYKTTSHDGYAHCKGSYLQLLIRLICHHDSR